MKKKETDLSFKGYEVTCFECPDCIQEETETHIIYKHKDGFIHGSFNKEAVIEGVIDKIRDRKDGKDKPVTPQ